MTNINGLFGKMTSFDPTDDDRQKALERAKDRVASFERIRRSLELPPEALYLIGTTYESALRDVTSERVSTELEKERERDEAAAKQLGLDNLDGGILNAWGSLLESRPTPIGMVRPVRGERRASQRISMPLRIHDTNGESRVVKPGELVFIVVMNPFAAFRADELHIENDAHAWTVESIRVGNREQLTSGALPGDVFGVPGGANKIALEVAQARMDIVVVVRRRADSASCFKGSLAGDFVA